MRPVGAPAASEASGLICPHLLAAYPDARPDRVPRRHGTVYADLGLEYGVRTGVDALDGPGDRDVGFVPRGSFDA